MKNDHGIQLGDRVRDRISGFEGICTGKYFYLNGCVRVSIDPENMHEGKPIDGRIFDVEQVEITKAGALKASDQPAGGPMPSPAARSAPSR